MLSDKIEIDKNFHFIHYLYVKIEIMGKILYFLKYEIQSKMLGAY